MTRRSKPARKTIADWLAEPDERRLELIDGELVEKAAPDVQHSEGQFGLAGILRPAFHRGGGGPLPGGWWIHGEVDVVLGENGYRPDLVGWRRERAKVMPTERPVRLRPDWICEVLSVTNLANDKVRKLRRYHQGGVPHYWIIDPIGETLNVYRLEAPGYLNVMTAERHETVRAEPFDAIELRVGLLFGDDPAD
jgi:Uma2 family endonuclease